MAAFAARAVNARDSNNGGLRRGPLAFTHHIPGDIHEHFVHMEPNISAAFDVIRQTEGGAPGQWNGGYQFDPASTVHPGRGPSGSSAAGPFQAEPRYWNDAQTGIGPTQKGVGPLDFSNDRDQQLAVIEGLRRTGSLEPLRNGNFDGFLGGPKLDGESGAAAIWQALPVGPGNLDKSHYPFTRRLMPERCRTIPQLAKATCSQIFKSRNGIRRGLMIEYVSYIKTS